MENQSASRVKTTETSFEMLEALFQEGEATREELEERLGMATSTVHRHLATLQEYGYVVRGPEGYRLSFKFLTFGGFLRREVPGYSMVKQKIDDLASQTDERAQFIIREGTDRVYLYTEIGDNPVQTGAHTGRRGPIHSSAAGKAIVAFLPAEEREQVIDSISLEQTGPNTITDPERLREDLAEIRERGYALNREESTAGVHAIGAPVTVNDDEIIGAISVSGPATRLKSDRLENELPDLVLAATNELELHIEHS
ncbi:IclR family transcriptional regulator [Halobellus clavatus]|jgi:DNA-binding IclR family transcriptional regulator|uniref:Transcriptional regulator, IclR family n=1 Tax=Halobellus clavatus TaxID=660517 RepID=A0A1H3EAG0_9EURY|nr:IclR family transcriptional regulator [Halobellus clavatus]SDX74879.1 transcriptional regulator, IclR family [Halobellus clavatus]